LPISNRTVKRLSADDSADSRVKVGHRQASNSPKRLTVRWGVLLCAMSFFIHMQLPQFFIDLQGFLPD
ncbi:MAG: hypothetical protein WBJ45_11780, partial [Limnohabitans sp.]